MKRFPNGYGGITKLSGNRRKPYMAYVNAEVTTGSDNPVLKAKLTSLLDAVKNDVDYSALLLDALQDIDKNDLIRFIESELSKCDFKASYKKKAIGYYATYKEASIVLAEFNKNPYDIKQKHTFAEVFELAFEDAGINKKSAKSIEAYRRSFSKCEPIHNKNISDIRLIDLQSIMDSMSGKSKSVQNQIITVMRLTFNYAVKYEMAVKDYSQHVKIRELAESREKTIFTKDEINTLWNNLDFVTPQHKIEIVKFVLILLYTGCRINELLNIRLDDINGDMIHVRGTKNKTSDRIVPVHPRIQPLIDHYVSHNSEYLVESVDNLRYNGNYLRYVDFKYMNAQLSMDHTFHEARHSFASYSVDMNPVLRSYILGHKNNNITDDTYTHPEQLTEQLQAEMLKYNPC